LSSGLAPFQRSALCRHAPHVGEATVHIRAINDSSRLPVLSSWGVYRPSFCERHGQGMTPVSEPAGVGRHRYCMSRELRVGEHRALFLDQGVRHEQTASVYCSAYSSRSILALTFILLIGGLSSSGASVATRSSSAIHPASTLVTATLPVIAPLMPCGVLAHHVFGNVPEAPGL